MATVSRDATGRRQLHKNDSTGTAAAQSPSSRDTANITTIPQPGKSATTKLVDGTQDAGSLVFNSGKITAGADKASGVADNFDGSFKQPTRE